MNEAFIDHLSFALGERTVAVEESAERGLLISSPDVLKEAGFERHHLCEGETTAYDLARQSVLQIADGLGDIGAIVYSTCIPANGSIGSQNRFSETRDVKYLMDFPASHLQADFKLDKAIVIGLNQQACTGMLGSLRIARMLIATEPDISRVLCVTADRFPEGALYEQSYNLISDGAAACVVSTTPDGFRVIAHHSVTNGAMAQASDDETVGSFFSYTHRAIQESLAKAGLDINELDWIVAQNTNRKAWQILSRLLKFDFERVCFPTIREVGHVISGDNIINLKRLADEKRIKSGDRALLFMAGYGLNWQCVILEKV
ncbi:MAG TPA: 3-oxoacyl-[acyl-carrier-protein] synthase III C-terminal domain-containing protein [Blastocatellia bacterium]|nr:3-oxoacyl-[acyl-carrier-protein] synthase III C-terminal domain-containing protein [Blastocatellia bacterium]